MPENPYASYPDAQCRATLKEELEKGINLAPLMRLRVIVALMQRLNEVRFTNELSVHDLRQLIAFAERTCFMRTITITDSKGNQRMAQPSWGCATGAVSLSNFSVPRNGQCEIMLRGGDGKRAVRVTRDDSGEVTLRALRFSRGHASTSEQDLGGAGNVLAAYEARAHKALTSSSPSSVVPVLHHVWTSLLLLPKTAPREPLSMGSCLARCLYLDGRSVRIQLGLGSGGLPIVGTLKGHSQPHRGGHVLHFKPKDGEPRELRVSSVFSLIPCPPSFVELSPTAA